MLLPPRRPARRLALLAALALCLVVGAAGPGAARAQVQGTERADLVRLPFPQDDGTLTPYSFDLGYPLVTLLYDTLLWRDTDGVPRPWLAESLEESADGRRLTARLREGVRWHDGRPLTAADVAFTYRFVTERPHARFTPEVQAVESVEAPDPRTVVFTLRQPSPGFADQPLADLPILPAHLWQGLPRDRLTPDGPPVGSGPYRLTEHRAGEGYRLEANRDYFRGPPAVGVLEVRVIPSPDDTLRALERQEIDAIGASLTRDAAERVEGIGTRILEGSSFTGTVLLFNLRTAPFDSVEVRRAVSEALDLGRVAEAVGDAVPAERGHLHPESPWAPKTSMHRFDEQGARQRLAALAPGPVEVLAPENDPVKRRAAEQARLALERVGMNAAVKVVGRDDLARAVGEGGSPPTFQAAVVTGPALASYDPDFLRRVFGSGAPGNLSGYASPVFDALADRVATVREPGARRVAVEDALRQLADDAPAVPLLFARGAYAFRPVAYDGWVYVRGAGILDKRSFVEPAPPRPPPPPGAPEQGAGGGAPLGWLALAALAVAGALALAASWPRRR